MMWLSKLSVLNMLLFSSEGSDLGSSLMAAARLFALLCSTCSWMILCALICSLLDCLLGVAGNTIFDWLSGCLCCNIQCFLVMFYWPIRLSVVIFGQMAKPLCRMSTRSVRRKLLLLR